MFKDFPALPQYQCHKIVSALQIAEVKKQIKPDGEEHESKGPLLTWTDMRYPMLEVTAEFDVRHNPQPGDYIVLYEDGYISVSPGESFEGGYTKLDPEVCLANGSPVTEDHREIDPETGQQKAYVVLSEFEIRKGFIRPLRDKYIHKTCGVATRTGVKIAETYASDPKFYGSTFCVGCKDHFPVAEFTWDGTDIDVGE